MAWIPCVVGRLNFSKVNTEQLPFTPSSPQEQPICFSYVDEHSIPSSVYKTSHNVVSSVFNWKDRADSEEQSRGIFRIITIGSTDKNLNMVGKAHIILNDDIKALTDFTTEILAPLMNLEKSVKKYQTAISENQYDPSYKLENHDVSGDIENIKNKIQEYSQNQLKGGIITVEYSIQKNGLVFLNPTVRIGIDDQPKYEKLVEHSNFIAIKQCFIFLKSSLHT